MLLHLCLLVALLPSLASADCATNIASCVADMLKNLLSHALLKRELLCGDLKTGIRCIVDQNCPIASSVMSNIDSGISKFNLECPFTPSQLVAEYRSGSTRSQPLTAGVLTCVVVARLVFMKLWMC
ncbi:unnamed protein product [Lymnaea stagnalis]|uniref:Uncharacterized protein n=1 Tax=Lymnaea stagnalis TaxID=6523 RepID=A0AAV2HEJ2_LYMST